MNSVRFGIDQLLTAPPWSPGRRYGLVTNAAARWSQAPPRSSREALQSAGFNLVRLFSPEHGLDANAADGAAIADGYDPLTGLPVVSLYGDQLRPPRTSLADLDVVLLDLPDIGTRFYTYIWTLSHVLEACADAGVPLVVLDRPNPLGGDLATAEGPMLDAERHASFLGRAALPICHALTMGELARLWNSEWNRRAQLAVIPCVGWQRSMRWPATGLPFVPTSPAMPSYESARLYPGLGLFEATNLSVGRGTAQPFQVLGAPWLRAPTLVAHFKAHAMPGLTLEAFDFTPTQNPFAGARCAGVRLRVTQDAHLRPVVAGLRLLSAIINSHPSEFQWATYPTAANPSGAGHFEKLIGRAGIREMLQTGPDNLEEQIRAWTDVTGWAERVQPHLLYT